MQELNGGHFFYDMPGKRKTGKQSTCRKDFKNLPVGEKGGVLPSDTDFQCKGDALTCMVLPEQPLHVYSQHMCTHCAGHAQAAQMNSMNEVTPGAHVQMHYE